jgi:hypothetical protein
LRSTIAGLDLEGAAHRVDHAAELNDRAVAGALHDAPVMDGDDGVDEIAAQGPQARKDSILVRASEPAISDDIRDQDRRELPGFTHCAPPVAGRLALTFNPHLRYSWGRKRSSR